MTENEERKDKGEARKGGGVGERRGNGAALERPLAPIPAGRERQIWVKLDQTAQAVVEVQGAAGPEAEIIQNDSHDRDTHSQKEKEKQLDLTCVSKHVLSVFTRLCRTYAPRHRPALSPRCGPQHYITLCFCVRRAGRMCASYSLLRCTHSGMAASGEALLLITHLGHTKIFFFFCFPAPLLPPLPRPLTPSVFCHQKELKRPFWLECTLCWIS